MDPYLTGNRMFTGDRAAATAGTTHILLTHGHDDHVGDAVEIARTTGAQIVSNFEICMFLASQGASNINPGNTGGTVPCGEFTVTFTQALHSSGTTKDGQSIYLGNPHGLVVKHPQAPVVYHMGDTDIFSDMALIDENSCAETRHRADRRSVHDESRGCRIGGQALLPFRYRDPLSIMRPSIC